MKIDRLLHPKPFGHVLSRLAATRQEAWIAEHYPHPPTLDGACSIIDQLPRPDAAQRARVIEALAPHNRTHFGGSADRALARLADPRAVVVITGQQPGLFGGPLFTLEKVAGAIALAAAIERRSGRPAVPIFWNQSEDHDLEETNRLELVRPDGVQRFRAPIEDLGRCLGLIHLDAGVVDFATGMLRQGSLESHAFAPTLLPREGETFAEWTSRIVAGVFADHGLLVAEPLWFRALVQPVIRRALEQPAELHQAFTGDTNRLIARGIEPQIQVADASMLFLVGEDGVRRRLRSGDPWTIEGRGTITTRELLAELERRPAAFSTNVQLRPIVQQVLFPVVAQVGGPAEVAYFAQFPGIFRAFALPLPVILPRPAATLLGPKEEAIRQQLGVSAVALLDDPAQWPVEGDAAVPPAFDAARARLAEVRRTFDEIASNEPLQRAVEGWWQRTVQALDKLGETVQRDREREAGVVQNRRARLADWVQPKGKPQDRVLSLLSLLPRAGLGAIRRWLAALDPLDPRHVIVTFAAEDQADG